MQTITGRNIKQLRKRLGLSQAKFAEQVGVVVRTVRKWEHADCEPRSQAIRRALLELMSSDQPN